MEQAQAAVTRLQAVAAESDGRVRLGPGIADKVMDSWQVPVPPNVRLIAEEIGTIWFDDYDAIGSYGEFFAQRDDPRAAIPYVLD
ncbi:hypothetical protein [Nocardia pseudovaccinii]|uniref:hypothetical protein n=1 Tax=Nocardia pseudovaccinii TaxID=189540 RepID=UPI0007A51E78|nr:hypothetical protein [Nocardia pseudovaccinii]